MKRLILVFATLLLACSVMAQWEEDVRLTWTIDTSDLSYGMSHNIAACGDKVHVVWKERSMGNSEIYYKHSTDGGLNWGQDQKITNAYGYAAYPSISLSGPVVHLVWSDRRDGNREIYYVRSIDAGESWEEQARLTVDASSSYLPVVAASGSNVHVAWVNSDYNTYWQIYYRHSPDGGITWESECCLSGNSLAAYSPTISASGSDVYLAWTEEGSENSEIYYTRSSDNGLTWDPGNSLTDEAVYAGIPSIASYSSTVHIVWNDLRDGIYEVFHKSSDDAGETWGEDTRASLCPVYSKSPNIAVADTVVHLVWVELHVPYFEIYYNYSTDGGRTWVPEIKLNDVSGSSDFPFIAASGPVLHVIWQDYRDYNYEVYYKRNPTGGLPVGLEDETPATQDGKLSLRPNPASQELIVSIWQRSGATSRLSRDRQSAVRLSIVDLYSREVKSLGNVLSFPIQVDITDLSNGVYILMVEDDEGNFSAGKFLKIAE